MATPNIVGVSTITGITTAVNVATLPTSFVSNASGTNRVLKINSIMVSNVDGTSSADVSVKYHPDGIVATPGATGAGTSLSLAHTISVAADSTLVLLDRASSMYLQENACIVSYASAASDLDLICSYEIIE